MALALSLGLTLSSLGQAAGVPVEQASEEQKTLAREKFQAARTAFDERRFSDALEGFRASYDVVASPNAHLMIAESQRELGQLATAYETFGKVAVEADDASRSDPKYADTAATVRQKRDALRAKIALLTIDLGGPVPAGARLTVAGRPVAVERASEPIAVDPGVVMVVLTAGNVPIAREIEATAGADLALSLRPAAKEPEAPPSGEPQRFASYGVMGLGGALLVGSVVSGTLALAKHGELEDACGPGACPPGYEDEIDAGRRLQTAANVLLGLGLATAAAGVVVWMTAPKDPPAEGQEAAAVALRGGAGWLGVEGSF